MIVLPEGEEILDFVCGDKDFWVISGAQHLAYVKPAKAGASTNLNLVTAAGHIYSFLLTEGAADADLKIFVTVDDAFAPAVATPKLFSAGQMEALRRDAEDARAEARAREGRQHEGRRGGEGERRAGHARTRRRLPGDVPVAPAVPVSVQGLRPAVLRVGHLPRRAVHLHPGGREGTARALRARRVATTRFKTPNLVNFQVEHGVYIVPKVLEHGYLVLGKQKLVFDIASLTEAFMVDEPNDRHAIPPAGSPIRDRRVTPRGVLPAAAAELADGRRGPRDCADHPAHRALGPARPPTRPGPASAAPTLPSPDRIGTYQQQLADDEVHALEAAPAEPPRQGGARRHGRDRRRGDAAADDLAREAQSVFADNVALSRRPAGQQPYGERSPGRSVPSGSTERAAAPRAWTRSSRPWRARSSKDRRRRRGGTSPHRLQPLPVAAPAVSVPTPALATRSAEPTARTAAESPAPGPRLPIAEATVIETVLLNRLDGTFAGPVACLVTTPVYSRDRQRVLIPAGARVLGAAVARAGLGRLAARRELPPAPHARRAQLQPEPVQGTRSEWARRACGTTSIATTCRSSAPRSPSAPCRASRSTRHAAASASGSFGDESRQAAGASLATSASRVLDRYPERPAHDHDPRGPPHQGLPHQRSRRCPRTARTPPEVSDETSMDAARGHRRPGGDDVDRRSARQDYVVYDPGHWCQSAAPSLHPTPPARGRTVRRPSGCRWTW